MAIVKVLGMETEYGIIVRGGGEPNPIAASSALINAYVASLARRIEWDFQDESPARDARGFVREASDGPRGRDPPGQRRPDQRRPLLRRPRPSRVLRARVLDGLEAVLYDKAGEAILARSVEAAGRLLPAGQHISVYKNNSDGKGNSYGTHENYLMDRAVPFSRVVQYAIPHFVTRQIYTGAGKVGVEAPGRRARATSRSPSGPISSKRKSASRRRSSGPSSTPATSLTATPRSTAGCT